MKLNKLACLSLIVPVVNAINEQDLIKVAPKTQSCDDAKYADECATAKSAAPILTSTINDYGLNKNESAAIISWQLNESDEYRFNMLVNDNYHSILFSNDIWSIVIILVMVKLNIIQDRAQDPWQITSS